MHLISFLQAIGKGTVSLPNRRYNSRYWFFLQSRHLSTAFLCFCYECKLRGSISSLTTAILHIPWSPTDHCEL